jgi:hypothetical protein
MFGRSLSQIDANGDPPMPRDSVLFLGAGQLHFISLRLITGSELSAQIAECRDEGRSNESCSRPAKVTLAWLGYSAPLLVSVVIRLSWSQSLFKDC